MSPQSGPVLQTEGLYPPFPSCSSHLFLSPSLPQMHVLKAILLCWYWGAEGRVLINGIGVLSVLIKETAESSLFPSCHVRLQRWPFMTQEVLTRYQVCQSFDSELPGLQSMRNKFLFLNIYLERGEGREKDRERNITVWLPLMWPPLGTWPATQGIEPATLWFADPAQSTELHQPGNFPMFISHLVFYYSRTKASSFTIHSVT